jgi:cytochrome bd ubiquinol oxidase subunit II
VWLIVAAAGMFAAFPGWYATMFSGFYLAFLLLLVALIARGATFLALKTAGEVRERALRPARRVVPVTAVAVLGFAVWTLTMVDKGLLASLPEVVAVLAAAAAVWLVGRDRDWLAFVATAVTVAMVVVSIFVGLYPRVMVSTLGAATDLTVTNTASSSYSLRVMTVVAVVFLPVVLVYQAWTYYVFRRRIGRSDVSVAHATDAPPGSVAPG